MGVLKILVQFINGLRTTHGGRGFTKGGGYPITGPEELGLERGGSVLQLGLTLKKHGRTDMENLGSTTILRK